MQLEGTLRQFPLRELIEMAVYSSVSGILEVWIGAIVGRIFFRDGLPQHAETDGLLGIDAIGRMFAEQDAAFRFIAAAEPVTPTLWMDPWELIDLAEHQAPTWAKIRGFIPSITAIPTLRGPVDVETVSIGEEVWPILAAIDGQRSIAQIARDLAISAIDACTGVAFLIHRGLVVLRQAPRAADPQATQPGGAARDGFFERLIARALEEERRRSDPRITEPRRTDSQISEPRQSEPRHGSDPGDHQRHS